MGDEEWERTGGEAREGSPADESASRPGSPEPDLPDADEAHVLPDEVEYPGPATALPPRVERWRRRSATGAMLTGFALGLREVLETEQRGPAIVLETSGVPPRDLAVEADLDNVPPRQSVVKVRRWLLEDPTAAEAETTDTAGARDNIAGAETPDTARPGDDTAGANTARPGDDTAGPTTAVGTPPAARPTEIRKRRRRSRSSRIFGSKG